jgi:ribosome biogenesis protein Nip4
MVNDHFPWIHIVRGRPRHPKSQGMIERSHGPYKRALAQMLTDAKSENWLLYMYIVQCEINNRPVKCRNNLSPYTLYYARPNRSSYSSIFGKAYKEAKTEYGLRVAKMFLKRLKAFNPNRVLSQGEVAFLIKEGDKLFDLYSRSPDEGANTARLKDTVHSLLQVMDVEVPSESDFDYDSDLIDREGEPGDIAEVEGKLDNFFSFLIILNF